MRKERCIAIVLVMAILTACFSGCAKEKKVVLKVRAVYGGYGVAGQDLGSGEEKYKIKDIQEGTVIYEYMDNVLTTELRSERAKDMWFLKIESIDDTGVKVVAREYSFLVRWDVEASFNSSFHVYDGVNYTYYLTFTKE